MMSLTCFIGCELAVQAANDANGQVDRGSPESGVMKLTV